MTRCKEALLARFYGNNDTTKIYLKHNLRILNAKNPISTAYLTLWHLPLLPRSMLNATLKELLQGTLKK